MWVTAQGSRFNRDNPEGFQTSQLFSKHNDPLTHQFNMTMVQFVSGKSGPKAESFGLNTLGSALYLQPCHGMPLSAICP